MHYSRLLFSAYAENKPEREEQGEQQEFSPGAVPERNHGCRITGTERYVRSLRASCSRLYRRGGEAASDLGGSAAVERNSAPKPRSRVNRSRERTAGSARHRQRRVAE